MSGVHAETITLVVGLFGFMCSLDGVFFPSFIQTCIEVHFRQCDFKKLI